MTTTDPLGTYYTPKPLADYVAGSGPFLATHAEAVALSIDAAQAVALRRLVAALDAGKAGSGVDWRRMVTLPSTDNDELAAAWAEVVRLCPRDAGEVGDA